MLQATDSSWKQLGFIQLSPSTGLEPRGPRLAANPGGIWSLRPMGVTGGPKVMQLERAGLRPVPQPCLTTKKNTLKFFFYWSMGDLQGCVNFCCMANVQRYTYTHTLSFSYSFPWRFITGYRTWFPVLYPGPLLLTYPLCVSLRLLIPASQSFPPLPRQPRVCSLRLWVYSLVSRFRLHP